KLGGNEDTTRTCFRMLRKIRNDMLDNGIPHEYLHELSMGMTDDFEIAIQEGSTIIRIGSAIMGPRN
ncbi:MAG: YggS family pyridoxal phosphate-dependent enzyme, partial [bacterium]